MEKNKPVKEKLKPIPLPKRLVRSRLMKVDFYLVEIGRHILEGEMAWDKEKYPMTLLGIAINLLENLNAFYMRLKRDPLYYINQPKVQLALGMLRHLIADYEQTEMSKWARSFLRCIGLSLFIPDVPKRRSGNTWLHHWHKKPHEQIELVEDLKKQIARIVKNF